MNEKQKGKKRKAEASIWILEIYWTLLFLVSSLQETIKNSLARK